MNTLGKRPLGTNATITTLDCNFCQQCGSYCQPGIVCGSCDGSFDPFISMTYSIPSVNIGGSSGVYQAITAGDR